MTLIYYVRTGTELPRRTWESGRLKITQPHPKRPKIEASLDCPGRSLPPCHILYFFLSGPLYIGPISLPPPFPPMERQCRKMALLLISRLQTTESPYCYYHKHSPEPPCPLRRTHSARRSMNRRLAPRPRRVEVQNTYLAYLKLMVGSERRS